MSKHYRQGLNHTGKMLFIIFGFSLLITAVIVGVYAINNRQSKYTQSSEAWQGGVRLPSQSDRTTQQLKGGIPSQYQGIDADQLQARLNELNREALKIETYLNSLDLSQSNHYAR